MFLYRFKQGEYKMDTTEGERKDILFVQHKKGKTKIKLRKKYGQGRKQIGDNELEINLPFIDNLKLLHLYIMKKKLY